MATDQTSKQREQVEALKRLHGDDPMAEHREWLEAYERALKELEGEKGESPDEQL